MSIELAENTSYEVFKVDDWSEDLTTYASGTRDKKWFFVPSTGERVLVKWPRYDIGEIYAEKICYELAKTINLPAAITEVGSYNNQFVIMSYSFIEPTDDLREGGDFFPGYSRNGSTSIPPDYTYFRLKEILTSEGFFRNLLEMLAFDCLVGNQDRHQDNWGIIYKGTHKVFAPLYDHSSCLGWNLNDEKALEYIENKDLLGSYAGRCRSCIRWNAEQKIRHFDLIKRVLELERATMAQVIERIVSFSPSGAKRIMRNIPDDVMSSPKKELAFKLLMLRKKIMEETVG